VVYIFEKFKDIQIFVRKKKCR